MQDCEKDPIFGQWRYDLVFTTPWLEIGWSRLQLFVYCLRGPNRWASFNTISSLKGLLVLWFALQIAFKAAAADHRIGFYAPISVRNQLVLPARFTMRWRVRFWTQNQNFKCYLFFCKLNFMRIGTVVFIFIRTSVFFAVRFTSSRSSPPVRNATHLRTYCFSHVVFAFGESLSTSSCPFAARFTLKTALNSHDECNEFADPVLS